MQDSDIAELTAVTVFTQDIGERVVSVQKHIKSRLRLGKSGIHGYGLIARTGYRCSVCVLSIPLYYLSTRLSEGEMVVEYMGDLMRPAIADLRERSYRLNGKESTYLFKVPNFSYSS